MKRFCATSMDVIVCFGIFLLITALFYCAQDMLLGKDLVKDLEAHQLYGHNYGGDAVYIANLDAATLEERNGVNVISKMEKLSRLSFLIATWAYFVFLESSRSSATIGKRFVGLKVIDLRGNRISKKQATVRFLGRLLVFLIALLVAAPFALLGAYVFEPFIYISGLLSLMFLFVPLTRKKFRLHDWISRTVVVEKNQIFDGMKENIQNRLLRMIDRIIGRETVVALIIILVALFAVATQSNSYRYKIRKSSQSYQALSAPTTQTEADLDYNFTAEGSRKLGFNVPMFVLPEDWEAYGYSVEEAKTKSAQAEAWYRDLKQSGFNQEEDIRQGEMALREALFLTHGYSIRRAWELSNLESATYLLSQKMGVNRADANQRRKQSWGENLKSRRQEELSEFDLVGLYARSLHDAVFGAGVTRETAFRDMQKYSHATRAQVEAEVQNFNNYQGL
jgi:hypothetical protein